MIIFYSRYNRFEYFPTTNPKTTTTITHPMKRQRYQTAWRASTLASIPPLRFVLWDWRRTASVHRACRFPGWKYRKPDSPFEVCTAVCRFYCESARPRRLIDRIFGRSCLRVPRYNWRFGFLKRSIAWDRRRNPARRIFAGIRLCCWRRSYAVFRVCLKLTKNFTEWKFRFEIEVKGFGCRYFTREWIPTNNNRDREGVVLCCIAHEEKKRDWWVR